MSENFVEEGDVTAAVIDILRNDERLNAKFPNVQIGSGREGQARNEHFIVVARRGGVTLRSNRRFMDHARVDIDTYGPNRDDCVDLARLAKAAISERADGGYTGNGLTVTNVVSELGITEQPDPQTADPRVFQSLGVTVASLPDAWEQE